MKFAMAFGCGEQVKFLENKKSSDSAKIKGLPHQ